MLKCLKDIEAGACCASHVAAIGGDRRVQCLLIRALPEAPGFLDRQFADAYVLQQVPGTPLSKLQQITLWVR